MSTPAQNPEPAPDRAARPRRTVGLIATVVWTVLALLNQLD